MVVSAAEVVLVLPLEMILVSAAVFVTLYVALAETVARECKVEVELDTIMLDDPEGAGPDTVPVDA
jgi:hypothetical protein